MLTESLTTKRITYLCIFGYDTYYNDIHLIEYRIWRSSILDMARTWYTFINTTDTVFLLLCNLLPNF